jgi:hypothetical protein
MGGRLSPRQASEQRLTNQATRPKNSQAPRSGARFGSVDFITYVT